MNKKIAYTAKYIFTGTDLLMNHAIVIADGLIENIIPLVSIDSDIEIKNSDATYLTAPFIDLQLYGASGKLLAVEPVEETYAAINDDCRKYGTAYSVPTLATNTMDVFYKSIDALRSYWRNGGKGIIGLHIEGPWIHPLKKGAHVESLIHSPTIEEVTALLDHGKDVIRIITLAPEQCSKEIIDLIRSRNILVFAGHTNATYEEATTAFNNGLDGVTHLYNAMTGLNHRSPGVVGAVFDHASIRATIIPDGHHVDFSAVRIAKKIMGERLLVITDAVTETTSGHYQHAKVGDKYEANGVLSGSALTMNKAVYNLVHHVGINVEEAFRMCSLYPAKMLNETNIAGLLRKDHPAEFILLDDQFNVLELVDAC
jgi:N-acetylglucosamine-6-phosphate deacetylase